ncbi:hypothetical protein AB670_01486 [Chryseobacterium sp. MOF25P]|uniref:hypothetical protein n=1 Tax=unclassified Chryseobacterium TaxID=2593645 RepID=UPI000804A340|nr:MULTISPECIES: hypothetical protein [unclassified Chryseobacterium]OBW42148.1 hypothetical protein AB670_01486 [Chryseobacterium sp. MOF25P]OBW46855.1 hypothetical protein AB671_01105 [Chryseobacterium sp. BGARF1]
MKNLEKLKGKAIKFSREELKTIKGGMRWTKDRACIDDRRNLLINTSTAPCCILKTCTSYTILY